MTITCPRCGKVAKKIKGQKYSNWYYCPNMSCNLIIFEGKSKPAQSPA